jgi:S1-C subfamily serine protease
MIINFPRDEILLTPYDDARLTPNRFSAGFRPDILDDGRVVVKALWRDSSAAKAGLEKGDVIVSFEAGKAAPAKMIDFIDLLGDDDIKTITLEVGEGDTTKTVTIEKAMLF